MMRFGFIVARSAGKRCRGAARSVARQSAEPIKIYPAASFNDGIAFDSFKWMNFQRLARVNFKPTSDIGFEPQ